MSCGDKDCPGCLMEETLMKLSDQGFEPEDMLMLFLESVRVHFPGHFVIQDIETGIGSIH